MHLGCIPEMKLLLQRKPFIEPSGIEISIFQPPGVIKLLRQRESILLTQRLPFVYSLATRPLESTLMTESLVSRNTRTFIRSDPELAKLYIGSHERHQVCKLHTALYQLSNFSYPGSTESIYCDILEILVVNTYIESTNLVREITIFQCHDTSLDETEIIDD